jgi:hypothetical protein
MHFASYRRLFTPHTIEMQLKSCISHRMERRQEGESFAVPSVAAMHLPCLNLHFFGARLCAKRQPQRIENAAAGLRHSRASDQTNPLLNNIVTKKSSR